MSTEKEFTFVTLTYNHSLFIEEHLNSILSLVKSYGEGISVDLIVSDDCSKDDTTEIADRWIEDNKAFFRRITRKYSDVNCGMISNLFGAIEEVQTRHFKFLAGDDKYFQNDIFSFVFGLNEGQMVVTPLIPFGEGESAKEIVRRYRTLLFAKNKGKSHQLMRYENYIPAPGVFLDGSLLKDERLREFLGKYRNIEDYPMWWYMLFVRKIDFTVVNTPYVLYRVNAGISTKKTHEKRTAYLDEIGQIRKDLKIRRYRLPKYINVFRYLGKINTWIVRRKREEIDNLLGNDESLAVYKHS